MARISAQTGPSEAWFGRTIVLSVRRSAQFFGRLRSPAVRQCDAIGSGRAWHRQQQLQCSAVAAARTVLGNVLLARQSGAGGSPRQRRSVCPCAFHARAGNPRAGVSPPPAAPLSWHCTVGSVSTDSHQLQQPLELRRSAAMSISLEY